MIAPSGSRIRNLAGCCTTQPGDVFSFSHNPLRLDEVEEHPLYIVTATLLRAAARTTGAVGGPRPTGGEMTLASSAHPGRLARFAFVSILLAIYYVMAVSAVSQKSMTFDEMAHLTAGYTYTAYNDYRLHPENGNWPQRLGALPAVAGGFTFPRLDQPGWTASNVYVMGDQFLYYSGNDADTMLGRGRAVMALLGVALGALVYAWSRRLVSPAGAWVSLVLFVFSPTLLAHGPLVTSDMAAALFFTAATWAIWVVLHRVTPATVFGAAALVAGVFLSKFSGPILVFITIVMLVLRLDSGRPLVSCFRGRTVEHTVRARQLAVLTAVAAVIVLVTWVLIWASYGFRYAAFTAATTGTDAFLAQLENQPGLFGSFLSTARQFHLLPEAYLYGFANTVQFASGRVAFLNGQFGTTGWWWYFPYTFAVKTTIPAMIVGLLALAALIVRWRSGDADGSWRERARASLYAGTPLLALVYVYWVFSLSSSLNIGHRHLLPTYPALCILAGGAVYWIQALFEWTRKAAPQTGGECLKQEIRGTRPEHGRVRLVQGRRRGDHDPAGVARRRVGVHQPELPGVLQPTGGRPGAGLQTSSRQFPGLGTGPAGAEAVAR